MEDSTRVIEFLQTLHALYPHCFKSENYPPMPLKIGIRDDLLEVFGEAVDPQLIRAALKMYCDRPAYQKALKRYKAWRIDLEGNRIELVRSGSAKPSPRKEPRKDQDR
jgi:sRNA-binding protein